MKLFDKLRSAWSVVCAFAEIIGIAYRFAVDHRRLPNFEELMDSIRRRLEYHQFEAIKHTREADRLEKEAEEIMARIRQLKAEKESRHPWG